MKHSLAALGALFCIAATSALPDAEQEARARAMFREVRCVVCQNESIDESQAELATDLRGVIRRQIAAGRTDEEIRAFLVARYGEFVLFRPAFSGGNAMLWLTPFAVVLIGGGVLMARSRHREAVAPLAEDESRRLQALAAVSPTEPDKRNLT